jgi:hypothetical protein
MRTTIGCAVGLLVGVAIVAAQTPDPNSGFRSTKEGIDFFLGDEFVARYHFKSDIAKPYLWPLKGPGGFNLTRAWPMEKAPPGGSTDHPHQKSVWFCHGDVICEGLEQKSKIRGVEGVDFWSEAPGHGRIVGTEGLSGTGDDAPLRMDNRWLTADGTLVLVEKTTIQLRYLGANARLFTFDIDLEARDHPVTFGDTKEGSFGVRINDLIREQKGNGKLENANGKVGENEVWGQKSAWCDYSGTIDGKVVGLAIFDDPSNPYPACWHARGYGLMAANPFGRGKSGFPAMKGRTDLVKLAKGEHLKLRYGILLHSGDAKQGKVAEYFKEFVKRKG